jgi:hypothetical protein
MYQGSPFDTQVGWDGRAESDVRDTMESGSRSEAPEFSSEGWRRYAAIAFAVAPGVVFLLVVALSVLRHA